MKRVTLVVADWMGYPLNRTKDIENNIIFDCGLGRLLSNISKYSAGVDFECVLVINRRYDTLKRYLRVFDKFKENLYLDLKCKYPFIKHIIFRGNSGLDIGAYEVGFNYLNDAEYTGDVVFMNSSVRGPFDDGWLLKYSDHFAMNEKLGLLGLTINSQNTKISGSPFMPHVQSFFLYSNMNVMSKVFPLHLNDTVEKFGKHQAIELGEIGISKKVLDSGYSIGCMCFPAFIYNRNVEWTIPEGDLRYKKMFVNMSNMIL